MEKGFVYFVGAGVGDAEWITLKAVRVLRCADVIIADRLVNAEIIHTHKKTDALLINAGKQGGNKHDSVDNEQIQKWMVEYALKSKIVVRLKGGDVSIYAQLKEEIEVLIQNGICFDLVPGISVANAVASILPMPLTSKNIATSVRILSFHSTVNISQEMALALKHETWVLYMSSLNLVKIVEEVNTFFYDREVGVAIVENVSLPSQRITTFSKEEIDAYKNHTWKSPSVIVMGKLVLLHKKYYPYLKKIN